IATGYVHDFDQLLWCRVLLGFFESGHWPCALLTTQRLLAPSDRTLGNSVLQSGTSIGAIITPLIVLAMLTDEPGSWRKPFIVVGAIGVGWVLLWLGIALRSPAWRVQPVTKSAGPPSSEGGDWRGLVCRLIVLAVVVVSINISWHLVRAWLPLFLEEGRGYTEQQRLVITAVYNGFTDVGCILAGIATVWLHRRGWDVQRARVITFTVCALVTASTLAIPWLPQGWPLLAILFSVAAGSLGLFPCYYAFSQEVSARHSGKVIGFLSTLAWLATSPLQRLFGWYVDHNQNQYDRPMAVVGMLPLVGAAALWLAWRETSTTDAAPGTATVS
ncbi:MAG: MFS transporter, partial [Planctomycetaceae bacterium]